MAGMSIGGLVSGLDTSTIISQLMQIESLPQNALKTRVTSTNQQITSLQSVNTRLQAVLSALDKATAATTWTAAKATSSHASVTATSTAGAVTGSVRFDVTSVASAAFTASAVVGADDALAVAGSTITVRQGTTTTAIDLGEATDVVSVAAAINASGAGVRAAALKVADGQYRLQVTSTTTGAASGFTVEGLVGYDDIRRAGTDAVIDLGAGLTVASADGRFADVLPGTSFRVTSLQQGVEVGATRDDGVSASAAKAVVDTLNILLQDITSHTRTKVAGQSTSTAGPLVGDGLLRSLQQRLVGAVTSGTSSVAAAGIQLKRDGSLVHDPAVLGDLLTTDPAAARTLVTDLAARLREVVAPATGAGGTVTTAVTRKQESLRTLDDQIGAWDVRLASRRSGLERQYSALETALGSLQSQSSWLSSQLGSLPRWDTGS
jgi:flagellar hook-associated protein 2